MMGSISSLLKEKRRSMELSAQEVVSRLEGYGINIAAKTLYGWESGHRQPDADAFVALCKIYGITTLDGVDAERSFSNEAYEIAMQYDALDVWGKRVRISSSPPKHKPA